MPVVTVAEDHVPATINNPELTHRVAIGLERTLGKENVAQVGAAMASEDFSLYALDGPKPPICMFTLGAANPVKFKEAEERGTRLPGPHSAEFAPDPEPTIRTGVKAMTGAVLEILKK